MTLPVDRLGPGCEFRLRGEGLDVLPRMKLVLARAGHAASLASLPEEMRREADLAYAEGKRLASHEALVVCGPPGSFPAGSAPEEFYSCDLACVFASSLGSGVDAETEALFARGASLKAVLLDAWASESLEAFNESIHAALAGKAAAESLVPVKMNHVERFSPGYGEVSVLANFRLLSALPPGPAEASEKTGILSPRKSTVCLMAFARSP
jgi:hypothetical protein